jgi:type VI secretion system protein VasD
MSLAESRRGAVRLAAVVCLLSLLVSCGTAVVQPPGVHVQLLASSALNPDRDGRPAPVMVHIYELAAVDDFRQAGFFDLYKRDQQVLGKAVLWRSIQAVRPGQRLTLTPPFMPNARYLAVFVAYRDLYRARWRSVVDLPRKGSSTWSLALRADKVSLVPFDQKEKHVLEQ